jgi:hypothetical protein
MSNEEKPEDLSGYQKDSKFWELLGIHKKTDARGRVFTNESYFGKEIAVFVSETEQDLQMCEHYYLLPYSQYKEIRKTKIKDEIGEPLKVQKGGNVYTTCPNMYVKIFVKVI